MPTGLENLDLKVYVDYPQERQNPKGPYVFATDGTQLDAGTKNDCIIDPVTLSVFGTPMPMTNEWKSGTGASDPSSPYYRFQKSDFTFTSAGGAGDWLDIDYYANGDAYIIAGTAITARQVSPIQLTSGVSRNEPLFFSYSKLQKKNSDTNAVVKLFWSDPENIQNNTSLHFNADGSCNVFRGYKLLSGIITVSDSSNLLLGFNTKFLTELVVGSDIYDTYGRFLGTVTGITTDISASFGPNSNYTYEGIFTDKIIPNKVQSYSRTESNYSQGRPISTIANPNDQFNDVYIIPMRGKELLVLTSYGLNFSHSFNDLDVPNPPSNINYYFTGIGGTTSDPTNTNISSTPVITPKGDFSIVISQGKVAVQLAKLWFKGNWSIDSQIIKFNSPLPFPPINLTGTISSGYGSTIIIGTSSLFTSELSVGDRLSFNGGFTDLAGIVLGTVSQINTDNDLYLDSASQYTITNKQFYKNTPLSGLVSYGIGSTVVTGSSTAFSTELNEFDLIYDNNNNLIGSIKEINSNTNLFLFSGSPVSGTNQTPIFKNVNMYSNQYVNYQLEEFGQAYPVSYNTSTLLPSVLIQSSTNGVIFNNITDSYKLTVQQKNLLDLSSSNAVDRGFAFYSSDYAFSLLNQKTSDSTIDITSALESLSINRSETGEMSLSLSARHKILEDLGVVKPDILSNRSIKVNLEPRPPALLTGLISFYATTSIYGQDTLFTIELNPGDTLYSNNGTPIGIIDYIVDDTELALLENFIGGTLEYIEYTNEPNYLPITIFDGYLDSPDIDYIQGLNYQNYALLSFNAIDKKQKLNANYFNVAPNFDNQSIPNIISSILYISGAMPNNLNQIGFFADETLQYSLPINRNNSQGQYNYTVNLGDSAGGFIEKIRSDFAQNSVFYNDGQWVLRKETQDGFDWNNFFYLKDLDFISSGTPDVALYLNEQSALDYGGIPIYESSKRTIRNLQKTYETPEANRILITGVDKTNGNRIEYIKEDLLSQEASLPPINRPDNWLGDIYPFVMINDKLNSFADVQRAGDQFYDKLTPGREIISFETDLLTYFDSTQRFVATNRAPLSGTITTSTSSTLVNGFSTLFSTELSVGETLYDMEGNKLGIISVINSDTSLNFIQNSEIGYPVNVNYNNYTYFLNQYTYIDIGNKIYINDLENNVETYMILDFSVDFIREYLNPEFSTIIPRNAKYRAKKITIPNSNPPQIYFINNSLESIPSNNFMIVTSGYLFTYQINATGSSSLTYSLSNEPVGMTIDSGGLITWVPGVGDENEVYEDIIVTVSNGTTSSEFIFTIRVYPDL